MLMVTRLDRLARSTRDLLNTLAAITGSRLVSARLARPRTGRLMLTVLGDWRVVGVSVVRRSALITGPMRSPAPALTHVVYPPDEASNTIVI